MTWSADQEESDSEFLDRLARIVAQRHDVDAHRMRQILERVAYDKYGEQKKPYSLFSWDEARHPGLPFCSGIESAFQSLGADKALKLFENADLDELTNKVTTFHYLSLFNHPLYSLDQLQHLSRAMIAHLNDNREHLLETGWPKSRFSQSAFFDQHLNRLCPIKHPKSVCAEEDAKGNIGYVYTWPSRPIESRRLLDMRPENEQFGLNVRMYTILPEFDENATEDVDYELAANLDFLSTEDAERLVSYRERIFDIKIGALDLLSKAIGMRSADSLWQNCLALIANQLLAEDIQFLFKMDSLYGNTVFAENRSEDIIQSLHGGVSDIFTIICHCDAELNIGNYAQLFQELSSIIKSEDKSGWPRLMFYSYYDVLEHPCRQAINNGLCKFSEMNAKVEEFWSNFLKIVLRDLKNELYAEDIEIVRVKNKYLAQYQHEASRILNTTNVCLEQTGIMPRVDITASLGSVHPKGQAEFDCELASINDSVREVASNEFRFSPDFRSAYVQGQEFSFTNIQAKVIKCLWREYQNSTPEVGQQYILSEEIADTPQIRLRDIFKNHPAWNTLIVSGRTKGTFRLKI